MKRFRLLLVVLFFSLLWFAAVPLSAQQLEGSLEKNQSSRIARPQTQTAAPVPASAPQNSLIDDSSFAAPPIAPSPIPIDQQPMSSQFRANIGDNGLPGAADNHLPPHLHGGVGLDGMLGSLLNGQTDKGGWSNVLLGTVQQLKANLLTGPAHNVMQLNASDRAQLANCDIAIIIDHSGSMKTRDCPNVGIGSGFGSRFEWSIDEMRVFASEIMSALPHGISLITFDNNPQTFHVASAPELQAVLSNLRPGGGTRLEAALNAAFELHRPHMNQPLLIAVVTDGEVNVRQSAQTMIMATHAYPLPNGVSITLLQIGAIAEQTTAGRMFGLSNLRSFGAAYEPFVAVPFSEVRRDGFARELLGALRRN